MDCAVHLKFSGGISNLEVLSARKLAKAPGGERREPPGHQTEESSVGQGGERCKTKKKEVEVTMEASTVTQDTLNFSKIPKG